MQWYFSEYLRVGQGIGDIFYRAVVGIEFGWIGRLIITGINEKCKVKEDIFEFFTHRSCIRFKGLID